MTIFLRPVGSAVPLDFFALAVATFVLSGLQLGWVGQAQSNHVALVLIGFAFPAQLLATVIALLARDGTTATATGVLSFNWLVVGLVLWTSAPGTTSDVLGLFLFVTATAMAVSGVTTGFGKLVPACVFLLAAVRLALTGVYELTAIGAWQDAAGVVGLVLVVPAVYAAWAAQLEDAVGRTVLPFGRRGEGKSALHGDLPTQVKRAPTEPGVRSQL